MDGRSDDQRDLGGKDSADLTAEAGEVIRYAVVGLGHIAQVAVLPAFAAARQNSKLVALVTDDAEKGAHLSQLYGVEKVYSYDDYDEMLSTDVVDAVYICLPNHLHSSFAMRALESGIHVLCEKPLALSVKDCLRLRDEAAASGARLMTAYRLHFEPANLEAFKVCSSGELGDLRYFNSCFSFQITDPENIRLQEQTGGGPIWDIGIYCINAARTLFQAEPSEIFAVSATGRDERFSEVEECASVILRFPGDRLASFTCSFGADTAGHYEVHGTKGSLRLDNAYEYTDKRVLTITANSKEKTHKEFKTVDQFAPELVYFSECIVEGREPEPSVREGLADVMIIRAIYDSIRARQPVRLVVAQEHRGPDETMVAVYPAHAEPETIHVHAPHS